jgi:hypothetical protein
MDIQARSKKQQRVEVQTSWHQPAGRRITILLKGALVHHQWPKGDHQPCH